MLTELDYRLTAAELATDLELAYAANDADSVEVITDTAFNLADIYGMRDPGFVRSRFLRQSGVGI